MSSAQNLSFKLFPLLVIIFVVSCNKKEQCSILDISRIELIENNNIIEELDTIDKNFSLFVYFNHSCKKIENSELLNELEYGTTRIEIDRAFILQDTIVESGTNLAKLEYQNLIRGQHTDPIEEYTVRYEFYEEFFF
jgi:hypothetical protein